jgi:hypothetical protein
MANVPVTRSGDSTVVPISSATGGNARNHRRSLLRRSFALLLLVAAVLLAQMLFAQGPPRVMTADPTSGKVDDMVTLTGENLGSATVTGVFLSDDKTDFKAAIVNQADAKITFKVPKVKAGAYNVSVQVSNNIYIEPVKFTVEE